jgi:hypothetical protein
MMTQFHLPHTLVHEGLRQHVNLLELSTEGNNLTMLHVMLL